MKKYLSRIIAGVLLTAMIVTCVPMEATLAAETNVETEESVELNQDLGSKVEADTSDQGGEEDGLKESEESLKTESEQEQKPEESAAKEDSADSEDKESENETKQQDEKKEQDVKESQATGEIDEKVNFVYIESPYLETPGTQRIVFAFESALSTGEEITLTVEDEAGNQEDWPLAKQKDGVYLFEKEYSSGAVADTYHVVSLNLSAADKEEVLDLSEQGIEAEFGVNREYDGIEDLEPIEEDLSEVSEDVEASVVTIDENGVAKAQDSIADALDTVSAQTQAAGISTLSTTSAKAATSRSGNIIVALDPGHDSRSTGASANGLKEEVLTLKIANYCKEELEKYAGVEVYMTRTGADCPFKMSGSGCIKKRVNAAADAGAQIFVSFHLNSSTSSSAKGAEVIVQNNNWKPSVGTDSKELGQAILDELVKVGLSDRGIYTKNAQQDKYENGSAADYYAVNRYSKLRGIPGIIIEHAFISNKDDANKYLKTESGLKKLGVADATGIAKYLGLSKVGKKVSVQEGTYVLESALGDEKEITVSQGSIDNYAPIVLSDNINSSSQRFEVMSAGDGYYYIVAEHSGKAIDVKGGSNVSGTALQQYSLNKSVAAQKWCFIEAGDGYYYLRSKLGTYMDVKSGSSANGTIIQARNLNESKAQKWKLIKSDYRPVADGTYSIYNAVDSEKLLDVASGSTQNKANIKLFTQNNGSAQRYEIAYVGDGYYRISPEHSGKSLDVTSGKSENGTNLQQYAWTGAKAQLWKFVETEEGYYYIRSKCGTVIDIEDKTAPVNTNVYMWEQTGNKSQKWKLIASDYRPIEDGEYVISNIKSDAKVMTEKNGNIQLEPYINSGKQRFKITYDKDGYYDVVLSSSGAALDVYDASDAPKTNLQVHTANGTVAQKWKFVSAGNGSYYIKSKIGTVVDLTSGNIKSGTNIQMYTMSYVDAQKWNLDANRASVEPVPIEEGTYTIQNVSNSSQVMDLYDGSEANSANIQTHSSNGTPAQRFEIQKVTDEYYRILIERSGKAVDVHGASNEIGTNVQQYVSNDSNAQLWRFLDAGNGEYYIQSKLGTIIDLDRDVASNGVNVEMNSLTGSITQKWKLVKTEYHSVSDGTYSFRVTSSKNQVLSVENGSLENKGNVELDTYNTLQSQHFQVKYIEDGYYSIIGKESGKALEYDASVSGKEKNVRQNEWNGDTEQLWKFVKISGDNYYIKAYNGQFLDVKSGKIVAGSNVQVFDINGGNAQKWTIRNELDIKTVDVAEGIYTIQTALNRNRLLDIEGGVLTNGGNVQIFNDNGSLAQKFKIEKANNGYYRIISLKSKKALDIYNASMVSGTNVQQYTSNNSNAQLWRFLDAGNGEYYIQSKLGTVLDVYDGSTAIRTNVWAYKLNQSDAQKWILDDNKAELYEIMGNGSVSVSQMVKMYKEHNDFYPYSDTNVPTIEKFCEIYQEECKAEGVKVEVAFCQAMLETGFLKFGGDVEKDQYNFAGLGATGGGEKGLSFPDIRTGIRAQVQHLKAYASADSLKNECVDPRFQYVTRGSAKYVQWLGIQENPNNVGWAASANYGYILLESYILPLKNF